MVTSSASRHRKALHQQFLMPLFFKGCVFPGKRRGKEVHFLTFQWPYAFWVGRTLVNTQDFSPFYKLPICQQAGVYSFSCLVTNKHMSSPSAILTCPIPHWSKVLQWGKRKGHENLQGDKGKEKKGTKQREVCHIQSDSFMSIILKLFSFICLSYFQ